MTHTQVNTLYKRGIESFHLEFTDDKIADLHYEAHMKRRVKNLLRLNDAVK